MQVGKKVWYDGVLNIPEGKVGDFEIHHKVEPPGTEFQLASLRTAMHAGHAPARVVYKYATRWHKLLEDGGVWMSDIPMEQYQHDQMLKPFRGRVLVGGLGLGYAITALAQKTRVKEIVVVDLAKELRELVWPYVQNRKTTLITGDLFEYLKDTTETFDYGFYDIWQSDGEATFHYTVMPLRRLSRGKVGRVLAWNEDVMRGQFLMGLATRVLFISGSPPEALQEHKYPTAEELATPREGDPEHTVWHNRSVPYWQWYLREKPDPDRARRAAVHYVKMFGIVPDDEIIELLQYLP